MSAASRLAADGNGNAPTDEKAVTSAVAPAQLSLLTRAVVDPAENTSSLGSASTPVTPNAASDGPMARIKTVLEDVPPMTKPANSAFSPTPTRVRAETFMSRAADAGAAS